MSTDPDFEIAVLESIAQMAAVRAGALAARAAADRTRQAFADATAVILKYEYEGDLFCMAPVSIITADGTELWTAADSSKRPVDGPAELALRTLADVCRGMTAANRGGWAGATEEMTVEEDLCRMDIGAAARLIVPLPPPLEQLAQARAASIAGRALSAEEYGRAREAVRSSLLHEALDAVVAAALAGPALGTAGFRAAIAETVHYATGSAVTVLQALHALDEAARSAQDGTGPAGTTVSARHSARVLAGEVAALNRFSASVTGLTQSLTPAPPRQPPRRPPGPAAGRGHRASRNG